MEISPIGRVTDEDLHQDIVFLTASAQSLAKRYPDIAQNTALLLLLTAATVTAIRNAPSGVGVALDLKELMVEAMIIARDVTDI